jgi:phosphoribosylanthranilate isomerase
VTSIGHIQLMTLVKICGITNLEDAVAAAEAGADMLGFNFYTHSPRYIKPADAASIIQKLPRFVLSIGVFVNEPDPGNVQRIVYESGVGAVQLHGDETPEYCAELSGHPIIRAFRTRDAFSAEEVLTFPVFGVLLDSFHATARGGTGHVANWDMAIRVRELVPRLFLAGGLGPLNIVDAITAVRPYGVDACSLLEQTPGKKNATLVREFVSLAKSVK